MEHGSPLELHDVQAEPCHSASEEVGAGDLCEFVPVVHRLCNVVCWVDGVHDERLWRSIAHESKRKMGHEQNVNR